MKTIEEQATHGILENQCACTSNYDENVFGSHFNFSTDSLMMISLIDN